MSEASCKTDVLSKIQFLIGQEKKPLTEFITVLCKSSPVFKAMLCGGFECEDPINVPDIEPHAFESMLRFVNGEKVTFINMDHAEEVLYTADKYDIPGLKRLSAEYIYPNSVDEMWCALECGLLYNIDLLKDGALKILRQNTYQVLTSKQFSSLTKTALKFILQDDNLDVYSEADVLEAVLYWARNQCKLKDKAINRNNIREILGDIIQSIRFLTMTETEILKYAKYILTDDETSILVKCIKKETEPNIVENLNRRIVKREKIIPITVINSEHILTLNGTYPRYKHYVTNDKFETIAIINKNKDSKLISVTVPTRASTDKSTDRYYFEELILQLDEIYENKSQKTYAVEFAGKVKYDDTNRIPFLIDSSYPLLKEGHRYEIKFILKSENIYNYGLQECREYPSFCTLVSYSFALSLEFAY